MICSYLVVTPLTSIHAANLNNMELFLHITHYQSSTNDGQKLVCCTLKCIHPCVPRCI